MCAVCAVFVCVQIWWLGVGGFVLLKRAGLRVGLIKLVSHPVRRFARSKDAETTRATHLIMFWHTSSECCCRAAISWVHSSSVAGARPSSRLLVGQPLRRKYLQPGSAGTANDETKTQYIRKEKQHSVLDKCRPAAQPSGRTRLETMRAQQSQEPSNQTSEQPGATGTLPRRNPCKAPAILATWSEPGRAAARLPFKLHPPLHLWLSACARNLQLGELCRNPLQYVFTICGSHHVLGHGCDAGWLKQ